MPDTSFHAFGLGAAVVMLLLSSLAAAAPQSPPAAPPAVCDTRNTSVTVIVVTGAGTAAVNGKYLRTDSHSDGLPIFKLDDEHQLYSRDHIWRIAFKGGVGWGGGGCMCVRVHVRVHVCVHVCASIPSYWNQSFVTLPVTRAEALYFAEMYRFPASG